MKKLSRRNKQLHTYLVGLFLQHQKALVSGDCKQAASLLKRYRDALLHHMSIEEAYLLPLYRRAGEASPGGAPELFYGEHWKLRNFLPRLEKQMGAVLAAADDHAEAVIELMDLERTYKDLVAHHDLRERNLLYPTCDKLASPDEQDLILSLLKR